MRVQSDQRSIALALESYYVDHKSYPAWAIGMYGVNNKLRASDPAFAMPTFMIRSANRPRLATLTTPVAYLSDYVSVTDPYAPTKGAHYGYWTDGKGWILYSAGPDETYDIVPSQDYTPGLPTKASLIHKTYDATNGSRSRGDIWKVKQ